MQDNNGKLTWDTLPETYGEKTSYIKPKQDLTERTLGTFFCYVVKTGNEWLRLLNFTEIPRTGSAS